MEGAVIAHKLRLERIRSMKRGSSAPTSRSSREERKERDLFHRISFFFPFLFFHPFPFDAAVSQTREADFAKCQLHAIEAGPDWGAQQKANDLITTRLKPFDARLVDTIRHRTADLRFLRRRVIRNYSK